MPRANRYFLPGYIWHITHRCHKRDFLLKFRKDRIRWIHWLFEAKKRYKLSVLNYTVTSNHIHLLVKSGQDRYVIPRSMQLLAARTAQEYNIRKQRKGAFWEDRYHATAIESGIHLLNCMLYIDMNMVRAGVVDHPEKWDECGYAEVLNPKQRYGIVDTDAILGELECSSLETLRKHYEEQLHHQLCLDGMTHEPLWSKSIAVGSSSFVEKIKDDLGAVVRTRSINKKDEFFSLHEEASEYGSNTGFLSLGDFSEEN